MCEVNVVVLNKAKTGSETPLRSRLDQVFLAGFGASLLLAWNLKAK
jgi:hypothetical protein